LSNAENHWLTLPLACASNPHELHGILADLGELPTHGAVPKHSHEIVQMPLGSWSQVQPLQRPLTTAAICFTLRISINGSASSSTGRRASLTNRLRCIDHRPNTLRRHHSYLSARCFGCRPRQSPRPSLQLEHVPRTAGQVSVPLERWQRRPLAECDLTRFVDSRISTPSRGPMTPGLQAASSGCYCT
jgi:hypothetical protein